MQSEKLSHSAESVWAERRRTIEQASAAMMRYLGAAADRRVAPTAADEAGLTALTGALPQEGAGAEATVTALDRVASAATVMKSNGRYFGFVNGDMVPGALGAAMLVNAWDQNAAFRVQSPAAIALEEAAIGWVAELLGLAGATAGTVTGVVAGAVVTGATMANFSALAAARHALLARAGWDVEAKGLFGAPEIRVVVGEEVHSSVIKALGLLGLGRERVVRVPVDGQGRMRAECVPAMDERTILCLQAGNVNTGAFDPAEAILDRIGKGGGETCGGLAGTGAWVHVDGAFGLWAAVSPRLAHLTRGFERADSWATDGHKWPNVGYDCGIALMREGEALKAAMAIAAPYLAQGEQREPSYYNPELSRRARGVELWATLYSLGRDGLAEIVERTCGHARRFAEGLRAGGCEVLNEVVINQVLVSFGSPERTLAMVRALQQEGTCWCGSTVWQGRTAMRISVSSWVTTEEDVERCLEVMLRISRTLA